MTNRVVNTNEPKRLDSDFFLNEKALMRPTTKHFHDTACGLDNVWLVNGFKVKATRHGNAVAVSDVDGLHHLIAQTLTDKPGRLTGKAFRFLRTLCVFKQQSLTEEAV